MSWATPAEALAKTGETITQGDLDQANGIVELFVGVTTDAVDNLKPRDLRLLKSAEIYQAAWMLRRVDFYGQRDVDNQIQDELQYGKGDRDMHILAPLAKNSILRLSWRRSRNIEPLTADQAFVLRGKLYPETYLKVEGLLDDELQTGFGPWRPL